MATGQRMKVNVNFYVERETRWIHFIRKKRPISNINNVFLIILFLKYYMSIIFTFGLAPIFFKTFLKVFRIVCGLWIAFFSFNVILRIYTKQHFSNTIIRVGSFKTSTCQNCTMKLQFFKRNLKNIYIMIIVVTKF